ncbi:type II/IV secretion system ATPase subunit [Natronococcus sp. A-GB7]|uniref:type II/IV secretion system ATPase subunit n=1 Tax=Natronococcus sp. A-GB7 TaxID=3037649 RepID=UPI00242032CC|nr:type II/IV secretion system ATPase subunit [Natronococcus sp. A-GB7]MDG5820350.1 type II/IV secretion system ATPase subunit [Natronococcus sp. A-GB7]
MYTDDIGTAGRRRRPGDEPEDGTVLERRLSSGSRIGADLETLVDDRSVTVQDDLDEDAFFSRADGTPTVASRYDLERAVPDGEKFHLDELERYWVNEPCAFVVVFRSKRENERKYYLIEPFLTPIERELRAFLADKLRTTISYADEGPPGDDGTDRRAVVEAQLQTLLERYDLVSEPTRGSDGLLGTVTSLFGASEDDGDGSDANTGGSDGVRPERAILASDPESLSDRQVEKLRYYLTRDFVGYERIDGIKRDSAVEDISCNGYESPVFVYHADHGQLVTNVGHGTDELDEFVATLAQRSGAGISKRRPQVDATLPDGSRAQLTLGREVADRGTNYTIRQFTDVPFTPIDLVNWHTFSLEQMALLWLAIENRKSLLFAGGTASGKTTALNAVSLFIPSSTKVVSIEDTRELELPQRNWIASVTRPSFADGGKAVDEFDLLEATLRQRPDHILMGEVRGEEGRTLFQMMSTGHTTHTTFHADSVDEVLRRFTTAPIDVSKTMFTALDLVAVQAQTSVDGRTVRRNRTLTEINRYDAERDEINVSDVYRWRAETDEFRRVGASSVLEEIAFDRGWSEERLERELFERQVVLAYLVANGIDGYADVAATVQAFANDPSTVLSLVADGELAARLPALRKLESVSIDVDPETEARAARPEPSARTERAAADVLERAEESLFERYRSGAPE